MPSNETLLAASHRTIANKFALPCSPNIQAESALSCVLTFQLQTNDVKW